MGENYLNGPQRKAERAAETGGNKLTQYWITQKALPLELKDWILIKQTLIVV